MECTSQDPQCNRRWNPGEEFPLCITNPCPLRQYRNEQIAPRGVRWKPKGQFSNEETPPLKSRAEGSLSQIRGSMEQRGKYFHPYNMKGAKKATTIIKLKNGTTIKVSTSDNKHSEMMAVDYMLREKHWTLFLGTIIWSDTFQPVTSEEFITSEPHCGFCTVMLEVLGLPHTKPTKGNYNYASNFNYPLPTVIKESPYVLARLLSKNSYCGFNSIKAILNTLISIPKEKWVLSISNLAFVNEHHYVVPGEGVVTLEWQEVIKQSSGEVLNHIWRLVFECIYSTNK